MTDGQLEDLDKREYEKKISHAEFFCSQNISKCIQLADIHVNNPGKGTPDTSVLKKQIARYVALIMRPGIVTPSRQERCMQLAYAAKLNSGCLSRQVGALVTDQHYSVKAVGWNSPAEGQPPCLLRSVEDLLNYEDRGAFSEYESQCSTSAKVGIEMGVF